MNIFSLPGLLFSTHPPLKSWGKEKKNGRDAQSGTGITLEIVICHWTPPTHDTDTSTVHVGFFLCLQVRNTVCVYTLSRRVYRQSICVYTFWVRKGDGVNLDSLLHLCLHLILFTRLFSSRREKYLSVLKTTRHARFFWLPSLTLPGQFTRCWNTVRYMCVSEQQPSVAL